MRTPTLPHVSVPHVSMPHVSMPHVDLADRVGDAWSTSLDTVHDLASAAADVFEDIPDKALALAGAVIPALRPAKRSRRPFVLIGAALGAVVVVAWLLKRRSRSSAPSPAMSAPGSNARIAAVS